jgi:hypothetical protein
MTPEQRARIEGMASGSPTWDLSDNDIEALKAMLARVAELEGALREAEATMEHAVCSNTCPTEHHNNMVVSISRTSAALATTPGGAA